MVHYKSVRARPQILLARVSDAAFLSADAFGAQTILFDAISAPAADDDLKAITTLPERVGEFSLLRVRATSRRLIGVLGVEAPQAGAWFELDISPERKPGAIRAQQAHLTPRGYTELSWVYLLSGNQVYAEDGEDRRGPDPIRSLGAAVSSVRQKAKELSEAGTAILLSRNDSAAITSLLSTIPPATGVIVRDVGQGSFSSLVGDLEVPLLHFDAGWPIPFNRRTEPRVFACPAGPAPVILSHWDFDHLLSFYRFPLMQARQWIVPAQRIGPGAARIAFLLQSQNRLLVWIGGSQVFSCCEVAPCAGPPSRSNDSGLALIARLSSGARVLMTGDAGYAAISFPWAGFDALVITHHGAAFTGVVPLPLARADRAAISVGAGNVYKHPNADAVSEHRKVGWAIAATSGWPHSTRGDVRLP